MRKMLRKVRPAGLTKVLKRLHYPFDVILLCVRWYVGYSLSLLNLEEMIAERGFEVDHSTAHRWVIKLVPLLQKNIPQAQAAGAQGLADGRTVCPGRRPVEISLPAGDKAGKAIFPVQRQAGQGGTTALLSKVDRSEWCA
jgi:putative transposase